MLLPPRIANFRSCSFRIFSGLSVCLFLNVGIWAQEHANAAPQTGSAQQSFQAAQTFQVAGDYERATAEYRKAIAQALQQLGNMHISRKQYHEAIELLARAVQVDPPRVEAHIDLAIASFQVQDFARARSEIETALRQDPNNPRALSLAGRIYFIQGNFEEAAARLEVALRLQPDFDVGYLLALTDLELKKPAAASVLFDEMLASSQPSASLRVLIGFAYRETGYLDQAVSHFSKALELEPKKPRVHSALGLAFFLQGSGSYAKAREQFQAELSMEPGDYTSQYYLGMIAAEKHNPSDAEKWFAQAIASQPNDPYALFQLGKANFDVEDFDRAVASLEKSLTLSVKPGSHPDPALAHELLGKARGKLGRPEEAETELTQAQRLRSQPASSGSEQASSEMGAKNDIPRRRQGGNEELHSMLFQAPGKAEPPSARETEYARNLSTMLGEAYHNLGVIDARDSHYANATDEFGEAARWNPKIAELDRNWGLAAFRAERYEQAIGPLERQLLRAPKDAAIRQMLGVSYYMTDQFAKSAEAFRPILEDLPDNPGLLYAAGVALIRNGDPAAGRPLLSRMLERGANSPDVHVMLAQGYSEQSQFPEALAELQRALELNPQQTEAHYAAGMIYFKQGKFDEALAEFNAELLVNPKSVPAKYQMAYVCLQQHEAGAAIPLLNDVLRQRPSYADGHYQLGKALLEVGDIAGAISHFETSVQLQPDQAYGYYQLSLAYRRGGRLEKADKALRTFQKLKEDHPDKRDPANP